jgi:integrase
VAKLSARRLQVKAGREIVLRMRKVRFSEVAKLYLEEANTEGSGKQYTTVLAVKRYVENYLTPHWGESFVEEITQKQVHQWLVDLRQNKGLSGPTCQKLKNLMSTVYNFGKFEELVDSRHPNPTSFRLGGVSSDYEAIKVTPAQAKAIYDGLADPRHKMLVLLCASTGLRASEACGLKWSDVDWLNGCIRINRKWTLAREGQPKTQTSKAPVPMVDALADKLKAYRQQTTYSKPEDWVFPSLREEGRIPLSAGIFVNDHVRPAAKKAGVQIATGVRFGLHNFRSSLATWIVSVDKADPKTAQRLLRHANVEMTLNRYAQTIPEEVSAAQERFIQAMEAKPETTQSEVKSGTSTDTTKPESGQAIQ